VRFAVEAWATEYGSPMEADPLAASETKVELGCEIDEKKWEPIDPPWGATVPDKIVFTDGVRRIDARVWIQDNGSARPGVCASYAAGVMCCDGRARLGDFKVEHSLFSSVTDAASIDCRHVTYDVRRSEGDAPEDLWLAIQLRMGHLEEQLAASADADLVIVDGPLRGLHGMPNAIGYVKTHHVSYLPAELHHVVVALGAGQRTPIFCTLGRWSRYSWYLRLPGGEGHPWAGVVRCETTADAEMDEVVRLANVTAAALPRFASHPHKDARAPQNLYPIAGLERELRRRLGDPQLLYRSLRVAAHSNGGTARG
jgi:hypothetical protein